MTPQEFDQIVEKAAIELGTQAGKAMRKLHDAGIDCTPLPNETFLGTLLRLQGLSTKSPS